MRLRPEMRGLAFSFHRAMDHTGRGARAAGGLAMLYRVPRQRLLGRHSPARAAAAEMNALRWFFAHRAHARALRQCHVVVPGPRNRTAAIPPR